MMKKNTKIALAVVALVVAVAALFTAYFLNRPQTQEGSKAFTVTVVHADGSSKEPKSNPLQLYSGSEK